MPCLEKIVSISYVQPVLQLLKTKTLAEDKEDSEQTRSVKAKILDNMERKYEDSATQSLLDTSSFLDPRFKADYISAENLIEIKAKLMAEMKTTQMEREPVFDATAEVQTGSHQSHGAPSKKRKKRTLGSLLQSAIPSTSSSVPLPTESQLMHAVLSSRCHRADRWTAPVASLRCADSRSF
ncbi:hypothetical protein NFI96_023406 [Prochilodus magdalenae]|nr:hypothetical protein NFI96_023406 [Prochilodus magdalenae]